MTRELCALCKKNPAEMSYEVDPEKRKPLCGKCFGTWDPDKLNALLGVVAKLAIILITFAEVLR